MMDTHFWLIRHALVSELERARLYGIQDVSLCTDTLAAQVPQYRALATRLPRPAVWGCTPLSRTRLTAQAIFAAGYPEQELMVVPGLIEQNLGEYQGLPHADLPQRLTAPAHPFWPLAADERPPGGESMAEVVVRVGAAMDELAAAHAGKDVVIVSHGGAIRAAVAHAMAIDAGRALHLSIHNISLTRLERVADGWRVVCVNEWPGM
ncbi:MAG: histidine phosphatase family protein [Janthinobacterium lividum]